MFRLYSFQLSLRLKSSVRVFLQLSSMPYKMRQWLVIFLEGLMVTTAFDLKAVNTFEMKRTNPQPACKKREVPSCKCRNKMALDPFTFSMEENLSNRSRQRLNVLEEKTRKLALAYAERFYQNGQCTRDEALDKGIAKAELETRNL